MTGAVVFENVSVSHPGGVQALSEASFAIPAGAFCVVLGPSGAGKSTLLRAINGLTTTDAGRIVIEGRALERRSLKALRRRIAMIYQHYNLVGRASVAMNVASGALPGLAGWRAITGLYPAAVKDGACRLVAAVGLDQSQMNRRAEQLSGGQQQRVGVARAFMAAPTIVLADEPVASLDPQTAQDILRLIRDEAKARGATVMCSLHQLDLAREFADWLLALRGGRVVFSGPAAGFWSRPDAGLSLYGEAA
jgi:phosphonate transport system ATP-binding protein